MNNSFSKRIYNKKTFDMIEEKIILLGPNTKWTVI